MATTTSTIAIVPASLELVHGFRECLDSVARERKWLGTIEAFPIEQTREFVARNIEHDNPVFFALDGPRVIGWVDITRNLQSATTLHCAGLGIGVHADYRSRGIGRQLLQAALEKAKSIGLIRVELSVYASNPRAIALYQKLGFVEEGRKVRGRYLDGRFDDIIIMALTFAENLPPEQS